LLLLQQLAVDKNLPTKEEVTTFANNVTFKYDFALVASAHSKEEHPAWKWDLWKYNSRQEEKNVISFYYSDQNSSKGYGSIYWVF
jgi:hypothetical protein